MEGAELNYQRLREAFHTFRRAHASRLIPQGFIDRHRTTLNGIWNKVNGKHQLDVNEAFRLYNLMKEHKTLLKNMGFDFSAIPPITMDNAPISRWVGDQNRTVSYDGQQFTIKIPPDRFMVEIVKKIAGIKWDKEKVCWKAPLSSMPEIKKIAVNHNFEVGERAFKMMNNIKANYEESYKSERKELNIPLRKELYDFQTGGVDYILKNLMVILADEMGLGKTPQSIAAAVGADKFPAIVSCPKGLRLNWLDEWKAWTNKKVIIIGKDNIKKLPELIRHGLCDVAITNYNGVETFFVKEWKTVTYTKGPNQGKSYKVPVMNGLEKMFRSAILDEAHNVRNKSTNRFKVHKELFKEKALRIAATGTPVVKGPEDLAALLELIGRIEEFGGSYKFINEYKTMSKSFVESGDKAKISQALHNLNVKLRSLCFIRREKMQVLKELPDKTRKLIRLELTNQNDYDHAMMNLQDYMAANGFHPDRINSSMRAELLVRINMLKQISARGKLEGVSEFVEEVLATGEKYVLFCWFNETAHKLLEHFKGYGATFIMGQTPDGRTVDDATIHANKNRFQTDPQCRIIICTYGKGSEGHTLTAASRWGCIELGWTYKDQSQAEDRIHRIGQRNVCECDYFLGADTIDEDHYQLIDSRRQLEKMTTGGTGETVTENENFSALLKKISAKRAAAT